LPGSEPPERTSIAPVDRADAYPAAIWLRPALWIHTNSTRGFSATKRLLQTLTVIDIRIANSSMFVNVYVRINP
jgi:hypothetical protein